MVISLFDFDFRDRLYSRFEASPGMVPLTDDLTDLTRTIGDDHVTYSNLISSNYRRSEKSHGLDFSSFFFFFGQKLRGF